MAGESAIRVIREHRGLTLREFAKLAGLRPEQLERYEKGRDHPRADRRCAGRASNHAQEMGCHGKLLASLSGGGELGGGGAAKLPWGAERGPRLPSRRTVRCRNGCAFCGYISEWSGESCCWHSASDGTRLGRSAIPLHGHYRPKTFLTICNSMRVCFMRGTFGPDLG
jgi:helix-turn-helix protein